MTETTPASDGSHPTPPLLGRVAIVTGAAGRGIGRATALALAREGADIVINTHRSTEAAEEVAAQVRTLGRRALVVTGDASDPATVDRLVTTARAELGAPGIVVASAGGRWIPRPIEEIPPEEWREAMAEEVDTLYLLVRATLPAMRSSGWGRVVTVGGFDADQWTAPPEVGPVDYALGKAARHWLVRTLARHEARHGVTFNAVAPGPVTRIPVERVLDAVLGRQPAEGLRRPTQVDVAEAIVRLCLDGSVTGSIVALPGPEPGAVAAN
jgi:NAD(P)-dependent dehydrogenase (short-subunit alcohol dehydrogenase family)